MHLVSLTKDESDSNTVRAEMADKTRRFRVQSEGLGSSLPRLVHERDLGVHFSSIGPYT